MSEFPIRHAVTNLLTPKESLPDTNGWKGRHIRACTVQPVAMMITALHSYIIRHESRCGSAVAQDYVLGPAIRESLSAVRTLLNGEIGALDGGTCDSAIAALLERGGWNPDTLEFVEGDL